MDTPSYHHSLDEHLNAIKRYSRSPPIFSRDFAYADSSPVILSLFEESRMAGENISDFSAASFAELLSGPTVDIYVGPQRKQWTLHKNLLCHYSSYFEAEFEPDETPPSNEQNTLELPDDDPRGFELLVKYLYQGRLDSSTASLADSEKYDHAVSCQKLYTLSTRLHLPHLSNLAIDAYRSNLHSAQLVPDAEEINEIYRSSPSESKMRHLMVRIAARQIMDPGVEKDAEAYRECFEENAEFAVEMVNAIREMMGGGMLFEDPTKTKAGEECELHEHEDGSSCSNVGSMRAGIARRPPKISSPGQQRKQPAKIHVAATTQRTPRKPQLLSHQAPAAKPEASSTGELLQPTTFTPQTPPNTNTNTTQSRSTTGSNKPRKLSRSPASQRQTNPTSGTGTSSVTSSIANESRKLAPMPKAQANRQVNGAAFKPIGAQKIALSSSSTSTPAQQRQNLNHVNGIVQRFDSLNGTVSESGTSGLGSTTAMRRQPVKLKRNT